jgi:hypothetical protein
MYYIEKEKQPGAIIPREYAGLSQMLLFQKYGDPRLKGWGKKWMVMWKVQNFFRWFPEPEICIHKDFQPCLFNAFKTLQFLGLYREIKTCDEAFNIRFINGSDSVLSVHSWGVAIDLNADHNPLGSEGSWSNAFIEVMHQNQIFCGQSWIGRKDPMHFSIVNG